ncbi:response regulator [Burkholderia cepacia]|uniref:response regulator n=1 Tax=Burkholderia cepacia TaxID=292 RepID=UPI0010675FE8|nr:transporter substrate-binding domain-containing protein [Burkholderia cepacia]TEU90120.1 response regulator [Burkholderia cepacia]
MVSLKGCAVLIGMMIGLLPAPGDAADAPRFTAEEKAWIAAHPVVRTRVDSRWRPFEFRENGKVVGVVPSFLDAIARISGLRFEYVDDVTWRDSMDALRSGRIDVVPDVTWRGASDALQMPGPDTASGATAGGGATLLRSDLIVSRPYFVGTVFVIASERQNLFVDSRNLAGRRVAIKGGGALEIAIRHGDIPVTLLTYDDERDALEAVSHGDADVAIGPDMSILPLLQRQYRDKLLVTGGLPDSPYALAIATRPDMPVLASILDKSLAAIPARDAEHIARQWIESADYGKPSLHSILYYRRWQVTAAGAGLLALAAIAFVSWRSRVAAVRSERDKAMFFAFISHEIRTPMHTILSSLELLQRSALRVDYLDGKPDHAGSLVIEVRDTGIGIPPERQRRIFEPYQRVEHSGNRRVGGSGLGLSICRELVDLMKGVITVSSSPDKGTIFTVIVPARRIAHIQASDTTGARKTSSDPSPQAHGLAPVEADTRQPAGSGPMILVVDDHEAVQHAIAHQLDALACRSAVACTGEQALAQFERTAFDMVLLDCDLPDIDGYTVVRRMRDSERLLERARTPIIAISASTGDAHRERCFDSGMDGVLGKPLRLDALRQMIDLWCPAGTADEIAPPAQDTRSAQADFRAIYRQSVDADLAVLGDALSNDDADRARHASHRIKGAAAVAGHAATSELAAELERRLQFASGPMPPGIRALGDELLRLHRADMAGSNARGHDSGNAET